MPEICFLDVVAARLLHGGPHIKCRRGVLHDGAERFANAKIATDATAPAVKPVAKLKKRTTQHNQHRDTQLCRRQTWRPGSINHRSTFARPWPATNALYTNRGTNSRAMENRESGRQSATRASTTAMAPGARCHRPKPRPRAMADSGVCWPSTEPERSAERMRQKPSVVSSKRSSVAILLPTTRRRGSAFAW